MLISKICQVSSIVTDVLHFVDSDIIHCLFEYFYYCSVCFIVVLTSAGVFYFGYYLSWTDVSGIQT